MRLWFNFFCRNVDLQHRFYQTLLGLPDAASARSPIYRALETPAFQLGFNADPAYDLLGLADRRPDASAPAAVVAYPTFMVDTVADVDRAAALAPTLGGQCLKPPFATYYGQWQTVLCDPEGNAFRLAASVLPDEVAMPSLSSLMKPLRGGG